jgi:hypothetical protein
MFDANNTVERELCAVRAKDAVRLAKVPPRRATTAAADDASLVTVVIEPPTPGPTTADGGEGTPQPQPQQTPQAAAASSITLDRAERIIADLVAERWLERDGGRDGGYLLLAPRALLELGGWLAETYNDDDDDAAGEDDSSEVQAWPRIKSCEGCKQIVTVVCPPLPSFRLVFCLEEC